MPGNYNYPFIDLTIVSAQDLKSVSFFGKNHPFVVAFVHPSSQRRTSVAVNGGSNPVWKEKLQIPLDSSLLQRPDASLTIEIYNEGQHLPGNKLIGRVRIPLSQISRDGTKAATRYEIRRPSGRVQGSIAIIANIEGAGDVYPRAPERQDQNNRAADNNPVMAYPANTQAYPPPPPPLNQGYPYNPYGYQVPYPQQQQPYYPPVAPPRRNRFGMGGGGSGLGLGTGLIGGALGGLLIGDMIGDMSYDHGYDAGYDQDFDSGMGDGDWGDAGGMGDDFGGGF